MIVTKPPVEKNNTGDCWACLGGGVPEGIRNVSKGTDYPLTSPPKSVECEVCASDDIHGNLLYHPSYSTFKL